jgi:hypothetical protein
MRFEDLTKYDINLIKSLSVDLIVSSRTNCRYEAISATVLGCIYAKGFKLSDYPNKLVKTLADEMARREYKKPSISAEDVMKYVFNLLQEMKLTIEKDESREGTWSNPKPSWYTPNNNYKKPWMM